MTDGRRIVEPQCHEFTANLNFNTHGLKPWFAADSRIKEGGGSVKRRGVDLDSLEADAAAVKLYYQDSAIQPPEGGETLAGTSVEHDTIREFRIHVEAMDGLGERKANFHIRPRWANMEAQKDDGTTVEISIPDALANTNHDAVNVRASGSNIPFADYHDLLIDAADALGISKRYFAEFHQPTSNIQDAARYVRIHTDASGPIHARTGPLVQLAHVLEDDRSGYRKLVQNDDDKRGRTKPGFYHTSTLGPERIREVWPNHNLAKEVKHYYKDDYHERNKSDPLHHPKLEAAYQVSQSDETLRYDDDAIQQLNRELDETVYSILADADIDLRGGEGSPYVADHYFDAQNALTDASIISLDLSQIYHEQESVVYKHLVAGDGLSPIQQEALGTLVTDGGTVSPENIADAHSRHVDAVYRALGKMDDLIEREYGSVSLKSTYVAELVHDAIQQAETAVERATNATAEALEAADRGLDERTSAFVAWCEKHDLNFNEKSDSMTINLGEIDADDAKEARRKATEIIREGFDLWTDMNREEMKYRTATWRGFAEVPKGGGLRSLSNDRGTERVGLGGKRTWRILE
jgi:hypothetical protein